MIFAAGVGSRLKPFTDSVPKALIPVNNRPMLEWVILRLRKFGINDIIINVHHYAEQIINFLNSKNHFDINIEVSYETILLDTGGGLKKAEWFFEGEKDILVHNTDILSDIDLHGLFVQHTSSEADATLCVRERKTSRYLLFDAKGKLCGWRSTQKNQTIWVESKVKTYEELSFNGIHIISRNLLNKLKAEITYPIIPEYLRLAKDHKINAFNTTGYRWMDLGKFENIANVNHTFDNQYFYELTI